MGRWSGLEHGLWVIDMGYGIKMIQVVNTLLVVPFL
jgi:hypothetical protein